MESEGSYLQFLLIFFTHIYLRFLKIEGANVPRMRRGENLYLLLTKLAYKHFGITIKKADIGEIRRFSSSKTSPILVK